MEVPRPHASPGPGPLHLLVDSTGLKLCGTGEWLHERYGTRMKERPDVHIMQVCAALGAAGGALVSVSVPAGNKVAEHLALDFLNHGFKDFLAELRRAKAN